MGKRFITEEEALALLPEGDTIHTFISNGGYTLLGTDWDRAEIEAKLHNAEVIEIAGENARSMQHGLAVYNKTDKYWSDVLFVQTDVEKLDKFDPPGMRDNEACL